jgi:hypothetical protein
MYLSFLCLGNTAHFLVLVVAVWPNGCCVKSTRFGPSRSKVLPKSSYDEKVLHIDSGIGYIGGRDSFLIALFRSFTLSWWRKVEPSTTFALEREDPPNHLRHRIFWILRWYLISSAYPTGNDVMRQLSTNLRKDRPRAFQIFSPFQTRRGLKQAQFSRFRDK